MRAFLAVDVDEVLVGKITEVQKQLAEAEAQVKFVEPENLHFTFKFFGDISREKADEIISMIEGKMNEYKPFEISIKNTGVFPHMGYMRVIWLGVENAEPFSQMQMGFDENFVKMGFKKERSYIPHLTIGRVKGAHNKDALVAAINQLEDVEIGKMTVKKIVLKQSELTPVGPVYTDLKEFEL
jgi:RNA 2',3'-cyclic 3'-phosphodiesterase